MMISSFANWIFLCCGYGFRNVTWAEKGAEKRGVDYRTISGFLGRLVR